ncbi:hypothetical protein GCM10009678_53000 [Actinomadura kijaniata]|uniref:Secreted protein n=1 Tax=Actinomadura namibiensis TaxID=182080 RepID=A0A7W3LQG4_ACTNM|nr:hypothetical protein [Actinomadura namibiensis]MBA8952441.1 hypothetical protein [Actinomadura namibiensis]
MTFPRMAAAAAVLLTTTAMASSAHAPTAHAAPVVHTYTCDRTFAGVKHKGWGWLNCAASRGAPHAGEIRGTFLIVSRRGSDPRLECGERPPDRFPSGHAELPARVVGFFCVPR